MERSIRQVLEDLNIPFKEHRESPHVSQGWIGIECPFCGRGTGKYGLGIHLRTFAVSCWKCSSHRLGDTLAEASGQHISKVLRLLPDRLTDYDPEEVKTQGRYELPPGVAPLGVAHRRYLSGRGFDPDTIAAEWGVQGIDGTGHWKWRLFIPVGLPTKPVSWTTRAISEKRHDRYLSAPPEMESVPLKHCLYGEHKARHAIAIVEGVTDAWAIGPGAVATFGLTITPVQIARLSRFPVRLIVLDNEPDAQRRADKLADSLAVLPGTTTIVRITGGDPATCPPDELDEIRKLLHA